MGIEKKVSETTWGQIGFGLVCMVGIVGFAVLMGLLAENIAAERAAVTACVEQGLTAVEAVKGFLCVDGVKP